MRPDERTSGKSFGNKLSLKTQKAAVRRTHFQIRSEAHDTYTMLSCVFFRQSQPTKCVSKILTQIDFRERSTILKAKVRPMKMAVNFEVRRNILDDFLSVQMHDNAYVCGRVPPFISHYQNSAFCVSLQDRKNLAKNLLQSQMPNLLEAR